MIALGGKQPRCIFVKQKVKSQSSMVRIIFILFMSAAIHLTAQAQSSTKSDFKRAGKEIGHSGKKVGKEVGKAGKEVGHAFKKPAKQVGRESKQAGKDIGHETKKLVK